MHTDVNASAAPSGSNPGGAGVQSRSPLVHKFETRRNKYIFDSHTNHILRADPATWDIIETVGVLSRDAVIRQYAAAYTPTDVAEAYDRIVDAQRQRSLFLPPPLCLFAPGPTEEQAALEKLAHKRSLLILSITEQCNFRCTYCTYGSSYPAWRKHSARQMTWETARSAINEFCAHSDGRDVAADGKNAIAFYGGEPLLCLGFVQRCVAYARAHMGDRVHFHVTTNGAELKGATAEFLAAEQFAILISLDGPQYIHDRGRRFADHAPTWETVTHNIREFVCRYPAYQESDSPGGSLRLAVVLSPLQNALGVEEFFRDSGPEVLSCDPDCMISRLDDKGSRYVDSLAPEDRYIPGLATLRRQFLADVRSGAIPRDPASRKRRFYRPLFEVDFRRLLRRRVAAPGSLLPAAKPAWQSMCIPGNTRWFVSTDGSYYPCERVPTGKEFEIGRVGQGIDCAKAYQLKKRLFELCQEDCQRCWCMNFCHVGCCANIRDGARVTAEAKRRECAQYRARVHRTLVEYFEVTEVNPHAFDFLKETDRNSDHPGDDEIDPS